MKYVHVFYFLSHNTIISIGHYINPTLAAVFFSNQQVVVFYYTQ